MQLSIRHKNARAAGSDRRAKGDSEYINSENIPQDDDAIDLDEYKMLTFREMGRLYETATYEQAMVYCGLTHFGKAADGGQYHESSLKVAKVLGVPWDSVRHREDEIVENGILERVSAGRKGHNAIFRIRREWLYPEEAETPKRDEVDTLSTAKGDNADTQSEFWSDEVDTLKNAKRDEVDTPNTVWSDEVDTQ